MATSPQIHFALDANHNYTSIKDVEKGQTYFCPSCKQPLIPKRGKVKEWHFAHKSLSPNCCHESYLHILAKERIAQAFATSPTFDISILIYKSCKYKKDCLFSKPYTNDCIRRLPQYFDLKEWYDNCTEEASCGKYRADLLLTNSKKPNREPVLIEIAVKHKCESEKIKSGYKIIEIDITSEDDVTRILEQKSLKEGEHIRFYNFERKCIETELDTIVYSIYIDKNFYIDEEFENCHTFLNCANSISDLREIRARASYEDPWMLNFGSINKEIKSPRTRKTYAIQEWAYAEMLYQQDDIEQITKNCYFCKHHKIGAGTFSGTAYCEKSQKKIDCRHAEKCKDFKKMQLEVAEEIIKTFTEGENITAIACK